MKPDDLQWIKEFNPKHSGSKINAGLHRCRRLWIGITKFDLDHLNPLGRHRERPEANPLTYFERIEIIRETLIDVAINPADFSFVPFPIENPSTLTRFLPTTIPCFTTICEEWNREKIRLLEEVGYHVIVLWERRKLITGGSIRHDIAVGGTSWQTLVPPATARAVEDLQLADRLRKILKIQSGTNE